METTLTMNTPDRATERQHILKGAGAVLDSLYARLDASEARCAELLRGIEHQISQRSAHEAQEREALVARDSAVAAHKADVAELLGVIRSLTSVSLSDPAGFVQAHEAAKAVIVKFTV